MAQWEDGEGMTLEQHQEAMANELLRVLTEEIDREILGFLPVEMRKGTDSVNRKSD